jgi:hypothetical protein
MDLKKSGGNFSSINSFPPKLKRYILDLSVLFSKVEYLVIIFKIASDTLLSKVGQPGKKHMSLGDS